MNKRSLGIAAMVVSTLLWLAIFVLPWVPLANNVRFGVGVALYGTSYAAFFAGGAWLGPEVKDRLRARFKSIFRPGGPPVEP